MHTSHCTESATYNLHEQTRDGRRRTSTEQSEAKIGQIRLNIFFNSLSSTQFIFEMLQLMFQDRLHWFGKQLTCSCYVAYKANNKITELRAILQRESQNS
jgi:hypothetical protein